MAAPMIPIPHHPGIYKRGSRYVIKWRDRGKQHKESHRTLKEAKLAKARRDMGETQAASNARFDDYAERWLETYRGRTQQGLAPSTRQGYRRSITQQAIPYFGRRRIKDIRPRDVRGFITSMQDAGIKSSNLRGHMVALKVLFATAYEDGDIASNPCQGIRLAMDNVKQAQAMTRAELALVLAALPEPWRPFFEFLAMTGLRISEAVGLEWQDVDLGTRPHVKVRRQCYRGTVAPLKTRKSRRDVPLSPAMVATLQHLRARRYGGPEAPLWATKAGSRIDDHNLRRRVLKPAVEPLGLPWVGFHTFRHTCASMLFEAGRNLKQIAGWLGHADEAFTLRTYVHMMDGGLGGADFLDAVVGGTQSGTTHTPNHPNPDLTRV